MLTQCDGHDTECLVYFQTVKKRKTTNVSKSNGMGCFMLLNATNMRQSEDFVNDALLVQTF